MIMKICDTVFIMPNNAHAVLSRLVVSLSHVTLCDPMDCSPQAPLSMGFSRQEYWSGCHALLQGIFLTQGLNPNLLHWKQVFDHLSCRGSPTMHIFCHKSLSYLLGTFLDCINEHKHFKDTYYIYIYIYILLNSFQEPCPLCNPLRKQEMHISTESPWIENYQFLTDY